MVIQMRFKLGLTNPAKLRTFVERFSYSPLRIGLLSSELYLYELNNNNAIPRSFYPSQQGQSALLNAKR